ncbi:hypothetical protein O3P69_019375 [Scylla paramamosain]|uniref:Antistasin-like domain-containing protein n=1 Tax=Scylla paramamosain TaxID=85552 RepID=A0AAW0SWV8_SCYPA
MTEAPPPRPVELKMRPKDCPVYVLGELRAIKKHGETWLNDGNACEKCRCDKGTERCYYSYCNQQTEVVNNPLVGRPPLDDEDGGEGEGEEEEGSGRPPPPPPNTLGDRLKTYRKSAPGELRVPAGDNDTRLPAFCGVQCYKKCPWGYKMDPVRQCRQCSCRRRCHDLDKCQLMCPEGLATDSHGCSICQCRRGEPRGAPTRPTMQHHKRAWVRGRSKTTAGRGVDGYTECNVTRCPPPAPCPPRRHPADATADQQTCCPACIEAPGGEGSRGSTVGRAEVTVQSAWERQDLTYEHPRTPTPSHGSAASDGAVKSAVQAEVLTWWQMTLIMVTLAVVCIVGAGCVLKHWRRAHRDKYDINSYRIPPPLTEKVRPVTTADDHVKGRLM